RYHSSGAVVQATGHGAGSRKALRVRGIDGGVAPVAFDPVINLPHFLQRLFKNLRKNQERRRYLRSRPDGTDDGQRIANVRTDNRGLVIIFRHQACAADDADIRRRTFERKVAGVGLAVIQAERTGNLIEAESSVKHIAKIERQAPRQCDDAHEAEHSSRARLDLIELSGADADVDRTAETREEILARPTRPAHVELRIERFGLDTDVVVEGTKCARHIVAGKPSRDIAPLSRLVRLVHDPAGTATNLERLLARLYPVGFETCGRSCEIGVETTEMPLTKGEILRTHDDLRQGARVRRRPVAWRTLATRQDQFLHLESQGPVPSEV